MDRAVAPRHGIAGFQDLAFLQNVIRKQKASRARKLHDLRQEVNILPFRRIHEDEIEGAGLRLRELPQNFLRIASKQPDLAVGLHRILLNRRALIAASPRRIFLNHRDLADARLREVLFRLRRPRGILLDRRDLAGAVQRVEHEQRRETYAGPDFEDALRLLQLQQEADQALRPLPDDGHAVRARFLFQGTQKRRVPGCHRRSEHRKPLLHIRKTFL